jgi:hypothetical protein
MCRWPAAHVKTSELPSARSRVPQPRHGQRGTKSPRPARSPQSPLPHGTCELLGAAAEPRGRATSIMARVWPPSPRRTHPWALGTLTEVMCQRIQPIMRIPTQAPSASQPLARYYACSCYSTERASQRPRVTSPACSQRASCWLAMQRKRGKVRTSTASCLRTSVLQLTATRPRHNTAAPRHTPALRYPQEPSLHAHQHAVARYSTIRDPKGSTPEAVINRHTGRAPLGSSAEYPRAARPASSPCARQQGQPTRLRESAGPSSPMQVAQGPQLRKRPLRRNRGWSGRNQRGAAHPRVRPAAQLRP